MGNQSSTPKHWMDDELDHVTSRLVVAGLSGIVGGSSFAIVKGLPILQTAFSITSSCAMASTACLLPQRFSYHMIPPIASYVPLSLQQAISRRPKEKDELPDDIHHDDVDKNYADNVIRSEPESFQDVAVLEDRIKLITSHVIGGLMGGSINGGLFINRPSRGIMLFTPIMLGVSWVEIMLDDYRRDELQRIEREIVNEKL